MPLPTWSPRSSTERSTRTRARRHATRWQAPCSEASSARHVHRGQGGPGGWWIIFEPELHLADEVLVPDLAGWRRERMPELPESAYFTLAPDWACEVLSPSTRKLDLQRKRPIYARESVTHLWLIDPLDRTLEAFELHQGRWLLIASAQDEEPISIRPFDAITFSLADLWK